METRFVLMTQTTYANFRAVLRLYGLVTSNNSAENRFGTTIGMAPPFFRVAAPPSVLHLQGKNKPPSRPLVRVGQEYLLATNAVCYNRWHGFVLLAHVHEGRCAMLRTIIFSMTVITYFAFVFAFRVHWRYNK